MQDIKNKKIILIVLIAIIAVIAIVIMCLFVQNEDSETFNTNSLTMMYETEAGSGEYEVVSNSSWPSEGYVFNSNLSRCENGSALSWDENTGQVTIKANVSDKYYVYFDVYVPTLAEVCSAINLADCIIEEVYTSDGENGLYYHDGLGTYTNASEEAGDNSYRYSGANPNNYVCFGSDVSPCPTDNLYRIVGVFDGEVKLIKYDYANSDLLGTDGAYYRDTYSNTSSSYYKGTKTTINRYYWNNNTDNNTWSESNLNTINLNTNYLNSIGSKWSGLIANHTWQVGGALSANVYSSPVQTAYNYEVGANRANTTYQAKIGLMYVSDYGYAASPENWTVNMGSLNTTTNRDNNWMFMGLDEWTISRQANGTSNAFRVINSGFVYFSSLDYSFFAIRPSFYLRSNVVLESGSGTATDPYRITTSMVAPSY